VTEPGFACGGADCNGQHASLPALGRKENILPMAQAPRYTSVTNGTWSASVVLMKMAALGGCCDWCNLLLTGLVRMEAALSIGWASKYTPSINSALTVRLVELRYAGFVGKGWKVDYGVVST